MYYTSVYFFFLMNLKNDKMFRIKLNNTRILDAGIIACYVKMLICIEYLTRRSRSDFWKSSEIASSCSLCSHSFDFYNILQRVPTFSIWGSRIDSSNCARYNSSDTLGVGNVFSFVGPTDWFSLLQTTGRFPMPLIWSRCRRISLSRSSDKLVSSWL